MPTHDDLQDRRFGKLGDSRRRDGGHVLRSERDIRDLFCIDTQAGGGWASGNDPAIVCRGHILRLSGAGLKSFACRGAASGRVELSDMPVARQLAPSSHNFVGSNYALAKHRL